MSTRAVRRIVAALIAVLAVAPTAAASTVPEGSAGTVFIQTVPALSGVRLSVGGTAVTTSGSGAASVALSDINNVASRVRLLGHVVDDATSVSLARVVPGPHVARESHLTVGLTVRSRVHLSVAQGNTVIEPSWVHFLRLHSVAGQVKTLDPTKTPTVTLESRRVHLISGHLVPQTVTWSVDRVDAGEGYAVTTANPRFDPLEHRKWKLRLTTVNGLVHIRTVPAMRGVTFLLEGASLVTGRNGNVMAPVSDLNNLDHRIHLYSRHVGSMEVSHMRVRKLPPPGIGIRSLLVAFDVRRAVKLRFIDHDGEAISARRVSNVELSVDNAAALLTGQEINEPTMLLSEVANNVGGTWQARPVTYSVVSAHVDGSNAVFAGTQRFRPSDSGTWTITMAMFSLNVVARDALFGSDLSSRAILIRPDGSRDDVQLGGSSGGRIASIVRGQYGLQVDAAAVGSRTTLLVSRDDTISLRVVTLLDAVVVLGVLVILLISVLMGGIFMAARREKSEASAR